MWLLIFQVGKEAWIRIRVGRDHKVHCDIIFCRENCILKRILIERAENFLRSSDEMEDFAVKYAQKEKSELLPHCTTLKSSEGSYCI